MGPTPQSGILVFPHHPFQGEPGLEGDNGPAGPDGLKVSVLLVQGLGRRGCSGPASHLRPEFLLEARVAKKLWQQTCGWLPLRAGWVRTSPPTAHPPPCLLSRTLPRGWGTIPSLCSLLPFSSKLQLLLAKSGTCTSTLCQAQSQRLYY